LLRIKFDIHDAMHNRFYIREKIDSCFGDEIVLKSIAGHIKAFRRKIDDNIELYDGSGNVYSAKIVRITQKDINVKLISKKTYPARNAKISLFLPLITSHVMDQIIARVCELEVNNIFPVITERSISLKSEKEINFKLSKWDKISKGAMIIAGKKFSTVVNIPLTLSDSFELVKDFRLKLIAYPKTDVFLKDYLMALDFSLKNISIGIFIGPEGDFSSFEMELSKKYGIMPVKLSNYIMSTFVSSIYSISNLTCFAFSENNYES